LCPNGKVFKRAYILPATSCLRSERGVPAAAERLEDKREQIVTEWTNDMAI
jgi:hypothetical protein